MKINKDWVEAYFEYGVDVANRCIFLTGDINNDTMSYVIKGLYMMDAQNQKHEPIELRISSYGGDMYDMYAIHDATRTIKSPVHTMGLGKIMSAAVLLLACGDKGNRWAGANTTFMIHVPLWANDESKDLHAHKVDVEETERTWTRWYELMGSYSNKPANFWRKLCAQKKDYYFSASQAQEWGLVDHLWEEK